MAFLEKLNGTRLRLTLVGLLATVPVIGAQFLDARSVETTMIADLRDTSSDAGLNAVDRVSQVVEEARSFIRLAGRLPEVSVDTPEACIVTFKSLIAEYRWASSFGIANRDGRIICSTDDRAIGLDASTRDYFQQAVATRQMVTSDVFVGRLDRKPSMVLALPQYDAERRVRQVVLVGLKLDSVLSQALQTINGDQASAILIDLQGKLLGAYLPNGLAIDRANFGQAFLAVTQTPPDDRGVTYAESTDEDGVRRVYSVWDMPWTLSRIATGVSVDAATAATQARTSRAFVQAGAAAATIVLLAWLAGEIFIVRPIKAFVGAAEALNRGDLDARVQLFLPSTQFAALARAFNAMAGRLEKLVLEDSLTGVANRRDFDKVIERSWARARRHGSSLALGFIDVDKFKGYNDRLGHQAGDAVLQRVGHILKGFVRRTDDLAARYGGEEFAVLLFGNTEAEAEAHCENLRKAVEAAAIPHPESQHGVVTVSIGVAAMTPDGSNAPADLLSKADMALYLAKSSGRNRVTVAPDPVVALRRKVA